MLVSKAHSRPKHSGRHLRHWSNFIEGGMRVGMDVAAPAASIQMGLRADAWKSEIDNQGQYVASPECVAASHADLFEHAVVGRLDV